MKNGRARESGPSYQTQRSARGDAAERLARLGADALGDVEILALATGAPVAAMLAAHESMGGIGGLSRATVHEIGEHVGPARGAAIVAAFELARRMARIDLAYAQTLRGPDDVAMHCRALWGDAPQETFAVLGLDARQRVRLVRTVSLGTIAQVDVHPREVFRPLVRAGCHSAILVHNHPSGEPDPSEADRAITLRLCEAGQVVGIPVLDHIIVTRTRSTSLAALGMIQKK